MESRQLLYRTGIAKASSDDVLIRGYSLRSMVGELSLAGMFYLLVMGELPTRKQEKMLDAILVACCEHGVRPPSIQAARQVASGGVQFQACVAGGILALGDSHGGAVEDAMNLFVAGAARAKTMQLSPPEAAKEILMEAKAQGRRLPGYGHPTHSEDPRTTRLLQVAKELGIYGDCCELAEAIAGLTASIIGRALPLNVDGAVAAIVTEMNFDPRIGKGIFAAARVFGIVAHVFEEKVREKPMAHLPAADLIEYDGPQPRSFRRAD
jgi:citrate synthase